MRSARVLLLHVSSKAGGHWKKSKEKKKREFLFQISFLYRYYILDQISPDTVKIVRICILTYLPSLLFVIVYWSDVANEDALKRIVNSFHPEYIYDSKEIWGGKFAIIIFEIFK